MTFQNEGTIDRGVRMIAGVLFVAAGWALSSTVGLVLIVLGGLALVTGMVGWCPAYALLGLSTAKKLAGHI